MKLITSFVLVGWLTYKAQGFVPSTSPLQRVTPVPTQRYEHEPKTASSEKEKYCIPLEEINLDDLPKVGGKTASLGEMIQQLTPLGVQVPSGFGVSSAAYDALLDRFQLRERLDLLLKDVDVNNLDDLASKYRKNGECLLQLTFC